MPVPLQKGQVSLRTKGRTYTIGLRRIGSGGAAEVAVARTIEGDEAT